MKNETNKTNLKYNIKGLTPSGKSRNATEVKGQYANLVREIMCLKSE